MYTVGMNTVMPRTAMPQHRNSKAFPWPMRDMQNIVMAIHSPWNFIAKDCSPPETLPLCSAIYYKLTSLIHKINVASFWVDSSASPAELTIYPIPDFLYVFLSFLHSHFPQLGWPLSYTGFSILSSTL